MLSESDPTPQLGGSAKQQSRQSRRGRAATGPPESSCNAQGIWCGFLGAERKRMSESKEGARSLQRSERVPGGVRRSKWAWLRNTGLHPLSSSLLFPSLLRRVPPLTRPRAPRSEKQLPFAAPRKLEQEAIVSFGRNRHLIGKQTRREKTQGRKRSCVPRDRACLMTPEAGSLHGWLKADTSIEAHEYSAAK